MISREEVQALITEARANGEDVEAYVREKLRTNYPMVAGKIRRNGKEFDAVDYIISDLKSYG